jgi:ubiquitin-protein ligase
MEVLPTRIIKETERIAKSNLPGIKILPRAENPRHFDITIDGPQDSAYAGGVFRLELFLPKDYPMVSIQRTEQSRARRRNSNSNTMCHRKHRHQDKHQYHHHLNVKSTRDLTATVLENDINQC